MMPACLAGSSSDAAMMRITPNPMGLPLGKSGECHCLSITYWGPYSNKAYSLQVYPDIFMSRASEVAGALPGCTYPTTSLPLRSSHRGIHPEDPGDR